MVADFESYRKFEERLGSLEYSKKLEGWITKSSGGGSRSLDNSKEKGDLELKVSDHKENLNEKIWELSREEKIKYPNLSRFLNSPEYLERFYKILGDDNYRLDLKANPEFNNHIKEDLDFSEEVGELREPIKERVNNGIKRRVKGNKGPGVILYDKGKVFVKKNVEDEFDEDYTTVRITRTAFDKANHISKRIGELSGNPFEIYMHLIGDNEGGIIEDILIPDQSVDGSFCKIDHIGEHNTDENYLGDSSRVILGWGHSHGINENFFSEFDRDEFKIVTYFGKRKILDLFEGKEELTVSTYYLQNMVFNFNNDEPFAAVSVSYEVLGIDRRERKFAINEGVDIKIIESTDSFDKAEIDRQILGRVRVNGNEIIPKVSLYTSEKVPEVSQKPVKVKKKKGRKPKEEEPKIPETVKPVIPKEAEEYKTPEEPIGIPYEGKTPVESVAVNYNSKGKKPSSDYGSPTKHEAVEPEIPKVLSPLEILSEFFIKLGKTKTSKIKGDIGKIPDSYSSLPGESEEPLEEKAEETEPVPVRSLEDKVSSSTNQFLIKAKGIIKRTSKYIGAGIAGLALALSLYANYRVNALDHRVNNHISQPVKAVVYEQRSEDLGKRYSELDSRVVDLEKKTSNFDNRFKGLEKQELTEAQKMEAYKRRIRDIEDMVAKGNYAEAKEMTAVLKGDINRDAKKTAEKEAKISEQKPTTKKEDLANVIFEHEVEPGDNLWKIVRKYLNNKEATNKVIYDTVDKVALFNGKGEQHEFKIGEINPRNPHYILPGQEIRVPRRLVLKDENSSR